MPSECVSQAVKQPGENEKKKNLTLFFSQFILYYERDVGLKSGIKGAKVQTKSHV